MTIYNVAMSVVELVEADSPEEAIAVLRGSLRAAGFEPYEEVQPNAFESEDLS